MKYLKNPFAGTHALFSRIREDFAARSPVSKVLLSGKLALKTLGILIWPPAARWDHPFSWLGTKKKTIRGIKAAGALSAVFLLQAGIHTATAPLFPIGEDYLTSQGIDPKVAKQLSDNPIRIRHRNTGGITHALFDQYLLATTLQGQLLQYLGSTILNPQQAWAVPPETSSMKYLSPAACMVTLREEGVTARQTISGLTGIPEDKIENVPLTDQEAAIAVLSHEFAHCDTKNRLTEFKEGDADARAFPVATAITGNPKLSMTFMHARAMSAPTRHDTALYLDAAGRGVALPQDLGKAISATNDAYMLAGLYERKFMKNDKRPAYVQHTESLRYVLKEHATLLSEESVKRAQMYIAATEFFVPNAVGVAKPVTEIPRRQIS